MSEPLVSIIIPCYNQGQYLNDAVRSALLSSFQQLEILIVDDGSSERGMDHSFCEAERLSPAVRVIHQGNRGLAGARNSGLEQARGRYLQFLDADDLLAKNKIDLQLRQFRLDSRLDVSISNYMDCDHSRSVFEKSCESVAGFALTREDFLYGWERGLCIPIHCGLFKRSALSELRFDPELPAKEDWVLWCSLIERGARLAFLNLHLAYYRHHDGNMCRARRKMGESFLKAAVKVNELLKEKDEDFLPACAQWYSSFYCEAQPEAAQAAATVAPAGRDALEDVEVQMLRAELRAVAGLFTAERSPSASRIGVVVPIYNHSRYLRRCIESALRQSVPPCQLVCIDDASTDPAVDGVLGALEEVYPQLRVVRHRKNLGIAATQNEGVGLCAAQYVAFLDCDDYLPFQALEEIGKEIEANPRVDYFFSDRFDVDLYDVVVREAIYGGYPNIPPGVPYEDLLDGMIASHLKVIRRDSYLRVGGCDAAYSGVQDWELALKIAEIGQFRWINQPLYCHRVHPQSVTEVRRVEMFCKTNQVRRRFQELRFGAVQREMCGKKLVAAARNRAPCWDQPQGWQVLCAQVPTADLKKLWREQQRAVFYLSAQADLELLNYLREFNSYFDAIICEAPKHTAALLGYLWSDSCLLLDWESESG